MIQMLRGRNFEHCQHSVYSKSKVLRRTDMALFNRSRQCYSKNRQVCKVLCTDTSVHKKQTVPLVCRGGVTEWGRLLRQPQKTRKYQPRSDLRPQGMICTSAQALRWFTAWAIVNACPLVSYSSSLKRIVALVISGTASCSCTCSIAEPLKRLPVCVPSWLELKIYRSYLPPIHEAVYG